ncbi:MAG: hypothetical protein RRZ84_03880 [Romboutsia sp.]
MDKLYKNEIYSRINNRSFKSFVESNLSSLDEDIINYINKAKSLEDYKK